MMLASIVDLGNTSVPRFLARALSISLKLLHKVALVVWRVHLDTLSSTGVYASGCAFHRGHKSSVPVPLTLQVGLPENKLMKPKLGPLHFGPYAPLPKPQHGNHKLPTRIFEPCRPRWNLQRPPRRRMRSARGAGLANMGIFRIGGFRVQDVGSWISGFVDLGASHRCYRSQLAPAEIPTEFRILAWRWVSQSTLNNHEGFRVWALSKIESGVHSAAPSLSFAPQCATYGLYSWEPPKALLLVRSICVLFQGKNTGCQCLPQNIRASAFSGRYPTPRVHVAKGLGFRVGPQKRP